MTQVSIPHSISTRLSLTQIWTKADPRNCTQNRIAWITQWSDLKIELRTTTRRSGCPRAWLIRLCNSWIPQAWWLAVFPKRVALITKEDPLIRSIASIHPWQGSSKEPRGNLIKEWSVLRPIFGRLALSTTSASFQPVKGRTRMVVTRRFIIISSMGLNSEVDPLGRKCQASPSKASPRIRLGTYRRARVASIAGWAVSREPWPQRPSRRMNKTSRKSTPSWKGSRLEELCPKSMLTRRQGRQFLKGTEFQPRQRPFWVASATCWWVPLKKTKPPHQATCKPTTRSAAKFRSPLKRVEAPILRLEWSKEATTVHLRQGETRIFTRFPWEKWGAKTQDPFRLTPWWSSERNQTSRSSKSTESVSSKWTRHRSWTTRGQAIRTIPVLASSPEGAKAQKIPQRRWLSSLEATPSVVEASSMQRKPSNRTRCINSFLSQSQTPEVTLGTSLATLRPSKTSRRWIETSSLQSRTPTWKPLTN